MAKASPAKPVKSIFTRVLLASDLHQSINILSLNIHKPVHPIFMRTPKVRNYLKFKNDISQGKSNTRRIRREAEKKLQKFTEVQSRTCTVLWNLSSKIEANLIITEITLILSNFTCSELMVNWLGRAGAYANHWHAH